MKWLGCHERSSDDTQFKAKLQKSAKNSIKKLGEIIDPSYLGNIHVLRKHKGGREGVSQMLTFAYGGGRGGKGSYLGNHNLEKNAE